MPAPSPHGATAARHTLLLLAVLPAALVATIATAVLTYLLGGPGRAAAPMAHGGALWGVLGGAALLTGAVVTGAAVAAACRDGARADRVSALCRQAARGRVELQALLRKVERGEPINPPYEPPPADVEGDPLDHLHEELSAFRRAAQAAVGEAASLACGPIGDDERAEVFVNLARRMQFFVYRQLEHLDELEAEVEDPELLKGLCHVDHQATRIRRHAENLAVLGGAVPRREWHRPVPVGEMLRSCIAETEHFTRVRLLPPVEGMVCGPAVADLVHLLVELVQNATEFSAPQTQVLLRARCVPSGLAIEVEDRGLGMTAAEQGRMNAVLAGAEHVDVGQLLEDGRVGLFVVSVLARRHRLAVQLQSNIYGGIQAVVVVPRELLVTEEEPDPRRPPVALSARLPMPELSVEPVAPLDRT
jgi:signal transduction histidine kinase